MMAHATKAQDGNKVVLPITPQNAVANPSNSHSQPRYCKDEFLVAADNFQFVDEVFHWETV